jgi:cytochrome c553
VTGKPFTSVLCLAAALLPAGRAMAQSAGLLESTVETYCTDCHNAQMKTGGLSLEKVSSADVGAQAATLEKVLHKLRAGEMPPVGNPGPEPADRAALVKWLETELDKASAAHPNPGAPAVHRLNKAEYSNAVRDLLGLDMDNSAGLPADDSGYGFDNIGDVLTVSPLHMEKYVAAARRISRLAVGSLKPSLSTEKFTPPRGTANEAIDELPVDERGGIRFQRYFPFDAEYSVLVRLKGNPAAGLPAPMLDVRLDGKRVKLFEAAIDTAEQNQGTRNFELRLPLKAGPHYIGAAMLSETAKLEQGGGRGGAPAAAPNVNSVSIDYVTIGGPYNATGPGETESRKRIFVCRPAAGHAEQACAKQILTALAKRAYRRQIAAMDTDPLMKLFALGRADGGSFEGGVEMALSGILVSPDFLFRVEKTPAGDAPGTNYKISDVDLASRLSFFLWSSIPDEELLNTAIAGKLHDPAIMQAQVKRMLADPKSKALVDNFAGQWLRLRNVADWKPDPDKFKDFDDSLRRAFERETSMFFENIIHEDRSVLEFIDADYTFLNDRLARFYGIQGVKGSYFRRVALTGPQRGGILTQGSVLLVTSYPTRTSPVLRGKWILESVLGAPPPPPPPNVPVLADSAGDSAKSLREQLQKHRANPACASCHSRLDPLGFSLENFDAVGKYRASEGGEPIEASGAMPNGTIIDGPAGLKKILLSRKDEFVESFSDLLLTYALGRGTEYYDQPAVREIRRQAAQNDYRFSSIVMGIVDSVPFEMRRVPTP